MIEMEKLFTKGTWTPGAQAYYEAVYRDVERQSTDVLAAIIYLQQCFLTKIVNADEPDGELFQSWARTVCDMAREVVQIGDMREILKKDDRLFFAGQEGHA